MTILDRDIPAGTDVGGIPEIAELFGIPQTNVSTTVYRRATNGFPAPLLELGTKKLFDLAEVKAWYAARGNTPLTP